MNEEYLSEYYKNCMNTKQKGEMVKKFTQGLCRLGLEFFSNGPENIYLHQTK